MKVFFVSQFGMDAPQFGESNLKRVETDYVKVNGELYHAGFVWEATPENLALYEGFCKEMREWEEKKPNMFSVLNKMKRGF